MLHAIPLAHSESFVAEGPHLPYVPDATEQVLRDYARELQVAAHGGLTLDMSHFLAGSVMNGGILRFDSVFYFDSSTAGLATSSLSHTVKTIGTDHDIDVAIERISGNGASLPVKHSAAHLTDPQFLLASLRLASRGAMLMQSYYLRNDGRLVSPVLHIEGTDPEREDRSLYPTAEHVQAIAQETDFNRREQLIRNAFGYCRKVFSVVSAIYVYPTAAVDDSPPAQMDAATMVTGDRLFGEIGNSRDRLMNWLSSYEIFTAADRKSVHTI